MTTIKAIITFTVLAFTFYLQTQKLNRKKKLENLTFISFVLTEQ